MPPEYELTEYLACPRCDKTPLSPCGDGLRCAACKIDFPSIGGIPWLFAEPDYSLGEWRNRLHFLLTRLSREAQQIDTELKDDSLHALTRERLQAQRSATAAHRESLQQILAPMDVQASDASYESYLALRTRLPADQGLHTYYSNLHRDWCWGDEENEASFDQIERLLNGEDIGDTLVLGAGACRLAYDLHMRCSSSVTIATDFNPLLLLVADRIMRGEPLDLHEFPIAPRTAKDFAVTRRLAAAAPVREGFHLVLSDMVRPPFAAGRYDSVVTPWVIDIVTERLPLLAARINGLLKPGGRWLNFGSLAFGCPDFAGRYSAEETLALVEDAGFGSPVVHEATIPYMCSPASRHGRRETVFSFSASKERNATAPARHKALPDWLVTGKEPVPLTKDFRTQIATTRIYSYIMSLIDGRRTIKDMAKTMEEQKLMTRQEAEPAIRNFLIRMYDDGRRQKGY